MRLSTKIQGTSRTSGKQTSPASIFPTNLKIIFMFAVLLSGLLLPLSAQAAAVLQVTPITWNTLGLDSNNVTVGPQNFPVGARVCNTGTSAATNVASSFVWDTTDTYINLRPGSLSSITGPASLAAGSCTDFYYEVQVTRNSLAYNHKARYHITATADGPVTAQTTTPRELFVEYLISQSRNGITSIKLNGAPVSAGGSMSLIVGQTYTIEMDGFTATQGYNQLEAFINFPNTIFQVQSVNTTYTADTAPSCSGWPPSPYPCVSSPSSLLYSDACGWTTTLTAQTIGPASEAITRQAAQWPLPTPSRS